jgi:hypothetical protein
VSAGRRKGLVTCHPLWTPEHDHYQRAAELLLRDNPNLVISPVNLFLVVRRLADYV